MSWKNTFSGIVALLILTGSLQYEQAAGYVNHAQNLNHVRLITSEQTGAVFELVTPDYALEDIYTDTGVFQSLRANGYGLTDKVGYPQLPTTSVLLGLPADGRVQITIHTEDEQNISGVMKLSPVPLILPGEGEADNQHFIYSEDREAYQRSDFYPESPAMVAEYGWLRDQHYVQIKLFPFQYNPAEGVVVWHQRVVVQVQILRESSQDDVDSGGIDIIERDSSFETLLKSQILNYDIAQSWRTSPPVEAEHQTSMSGERLRIVVEQDGLYRISYADLITAGMAGVDPRTLKMTNQGLNVAIEVAGEEDGILNEEDYILFYGEAYRGDTMAAWYADENQNWITFTQQLPDGTTTLWHPVFSAAMMEKYSTENVYWLQAVTDGTQARMEVVNGTPGDAIVPAYYRTTQHAEVQFERWEFHYTNEDTWFWKYVTNTTQRLFSTTITGIYTEPFTAVVRSEYVGYTYSNLLSPDHHVEFKLNTRVEPLYESYWDGRSRHMFEVEIPSSDLIDGLNTLYFQIIEDDSVTSYVAFDWYEIDFLRRFVAYNDEFAFPGEAIGTWRYNLDGFTQADIRVYDISDVHLPKKIDNVSTYLDGTYRADFQYTHDAGAEFFAVGGNAIRSPKSITRYAPPDLRATTNGADYLIIAHADFLATGQVLANYRASQGYRVRLVDVQDLYNEFNEGIRHPLAIKNFLEYTFSYWTPPAPLYVVLVGDGHWDLLDTGYTYTTTPVYMPPNLSWVDPIQGEVDSSNLLATIVGDDPLPDVYIGRIPVNTPLEFQNVINKIIAFESINNQPWQLNSTFIADNTPDAVGNFPAMADFIINDYIEPGFTPIRIYEDDYGCSSADPTACAAVTAAIMDTFNNTGALFATYIGHAAVQNWSHERIFVLSNIATLTNQSQLPVVLSMDCLDGYWIHPNLQPSMAEALIRTANVGAAATFSPAGLGVGLGHYSLMDGFFGAVYRDGLWEMGAATLGAKVALYNAGYFRDMLHTYTTFGDPALKFPNPYDLTVSPVQAAQQATPGTRLTYPVQISNTGTFPDTIEITVDGNIWPTYPEVSLLNLGAGETIEVLITVDIPAGIPGGVTDTALVRVISDGDAAELKTVTINSTALVRVRLPMMRK